jgi:DNA-binding transcriptional LysR family regulator
MVPSIRLRDTLNTASVLLNRLLSRGKFRHVQVLLKLAEVGSVQRTADAIGMTQSSVTQTLAYLERLLETKLFDRHARGVRPTQACTDLLPMARQVLKGISEGAEVVVARSSRGRGMVRLVASVSATHGLLVETLRAFGERHPGVEVHLTEAEGDDQLLAVARGEVDLVACRRPPIIPEGWEFIPLLEDRFAVVCRAEHPLARARRVSWSELATETWLLTPAGTAARVRFDELTQKFPQRPRTHAVITRSPTMLWWLLRHERALAFLSLNFTKPLIDIGELGELNVQPANPIETLGILQPISQRVEAAAILSTYLQAHFSAGRRKR